VAERRPATSPERRTDLFGAVLIAGGTVQFGAIVVLGRIATRPGGIPVPALLAYRFGLAAVLLGLLLVALGQPLRPAAGEGWRLWLLGTGGYAAEAGFFFAGLRHGTAAALTLLFFTYPVLVSAIAIVTGRGSPGWLIGGSLVSAVAGAAIVVASAGGVEVDSTGVALALGAAVLFSVYLTGAEVVLKRTNSLTGATWVSAAAAVGLAAYAGITGAAEWPDGWRQWGPVLGMAGFTAGAFVCLFAGLRRLGAVRTAIVSAAEPLTAALLAAVFLEESVGTGTLVGGLLIVAGAVAAAVARAGGPPEPQVP